MSVSRLHFCFVTPNNVTTHIKFAITVTLSPFSTCTLRRINARTKEMLAADWVEEVRGLVERYGDLSPTAAEAAGYALLADVVRGRLRLEDAGEEIKIRTRQLAKRQMSWFRRFRGVTWLSGDAPLRSNVGRVLDAWPA